MPDDYDVIIVGAGPAGGSAAFFLGEAGKRVLVLEREKLPRYKTCGGGISTQFLSKEFPFSFEPILETDVKKMTYDCWGVAVTIPVTGGAIGMVMRDRFDAFLLGHAHVEVRQGIEVRKIVEGPAGVTVETRSGEQFHAHYLIGADGANSMVAHSVGLRSGRRLAAAIEVEVPASPEQVQRFAANPVFIFGEIHFGYMWIFPKKDHLSIGVAGLHPKRGELQKKLRKVMASRYGLSLENVPLHGHPIPLYNRRERISTARTLLVGDAAGLVDPLSGEGIRYAIKSGRLAAQAILSGRPEQYAQMIYHEIGINHSLAMLVGLFFYNLQPLCLLFGAPNPFTTQAIADLLSDQAGTWEVMVRAIATLPIFWLTEGLAALAGLFRGRQDSEKIRARIYGVG